MLLPQLTIVGAGLIGGSLALAARERKIAQTIVALDRTPRPHNDTGDVFDDWLTTDATPEATRALSTSSLTILCVPVGTIIELLPTVLDSTRGVVTDCGSTKAAITQQVRRHPGRQRFVAGHPMAGHPVGGLENARGDLFHGRTWLLCPEADQTDAEALVSDFVREIGADIVKLSALDHDSSVAITSHIPQVVASALAVHASATNALSAAGPGFASATRVAGGAEAMWKDIFETNSGPIGAQLTQIAAELTKLGATLTSGDPTGALRLLERARKLRENDI